MLIREKSQNMQIKLKPEQSIYYEERKKGEKRVVEIYFGFEPQSLEVDCSDEKKSVESLNSFQYFLSKKFRELEANVDSSSRILPN